MADMTVTDILHRKGIKMVLIAGPSSSGKTTFAKRLGIQLRLNGFKPVTISVDNYFVESKDNPRDENGIVLLELIGENDLSKMALYRELNTPDGSWSILFIMII